MAWCLVKHRDNFTIYHRVQTVSGAHPVSHPMRTRGSYSGVKRPGREADHFHLVPRLRTRGAIHPLSQYVLMAWRLIKHSIRLRGVVLS